MLRSNPLKEKTWSGRKRRRWSIFDILERHIPKRRKEQHHVLISPLVLHHLYTRAFSAHFSSRSFSHLSRNSSSSSDVRRGLSRARAASSSSTSTQQMFFSPTKNEKSDAKRSHHRTLVLAGLYAKWRNNTPLTCTLLL